MKKNESIVSAIISIVLGFMLTIMKSEVISIAITILGIAILISAIIDFLNKLTNAAIIKGVIGICILVFGWMFVNLALYILAAAIIVMGLLQIANMRNFVPVNLTTMDKVLIYLKPIITVLAGACLLFHQGGTIDWIFIVAGVLLIIEGILNLLYAMKG